MSISLNTLVCLLLSLLKSSPIFSAREIFLQQWEWGRASINWAWASSNGQFVTGEHAIAMKLSFCRNQQQLNNCVTMSILDLGFTGKYHSTKTVSGQLWSTANISVFYVDLAAYVTENIKFHGLVSQDSLPWFSPHFWSKAIWCSLPGGWVVNLLVMLLL